MYKVIRNILCRGSVAAVLLAGLIAAPMSVEAKTRKITVKAGSETVIQQMYWIDRKCVPDAVPPKAKVQQAPKMGSIRLHNEPAKTVQCPSVKANSVFVLYKAGDTLGKDRVKINWKPSSDPSFSQTYVITIE